MNRYVTQLLINEIDRIYEDTSKNGIDATVNAITVILGDCGQEALAALVKYNSWDGRISQRAKNWADSIPNVALKEKEYLVTQIHLCHIDQIACKIAQSK